MTTAAHIASDAVDDAIHASQRAIKAVQRGARDLGDMRHDVAHRVRQAPLTAIGLAFGAGVLFAAMAGLVCRPARITRT